MADTIEQLDTISDRDSEEMSDTDSEEMSEQERLVRCLHKVAGPAAII